MNEQVHPVFHTVLAMIAPKVPPSGRIRMTLELIPVHEACPPPEKEVLLFVDGERDAVPGFFDNTEWCDASGHSINACVRYWADKPVWMAP